MQQCEDSFLNPLVIGFQMSPGSSCQEGCRTAAFVVTPVLRRRFLREIENEQTWDCPIPRSRRGQPTPYFGWKAALRLPQ